GARRPRAHLQWHAAGIPPRRRTRRDDRTVGDGSGRALARRLSGLSEDDVDEPEVLCGLRIEDEVPVAVAADLLRAASGVRREHPFDLAALPDELIGGDDEVGNRPPGTLGVRLARPRPRVPGPGAPAGARRPQ